MMAGVSSFQIKFSDLPCHQRRCHLSDDTVIEASFIWEEPESTVYLFGDTQKDVWTVQSGEEKAQRGE